MQTTVLLIFGVVYLDMIPGGLPFLQLDRTGIALVPAVMLLLPVATHELAGPLLALASTLAGNLLIVGSIANIIVVDAARSRGVYIDWKRHAATGIPVTLVTLAIAWAYLWFRVLH